MQHWGFNLTASEGGDQVRDHNLTLKVSLRPARV